MEYKNDIGETIIDPCKDTVCIFLDTELGLMRVDYPSSAGEPMSLNDIYDSFKDHEQMIYVVSDGSFAGSIFRCGNYEKGVWQKYAVTQGFA